MYNKLLEWFLAVMNGLKAGTTEEAWLASFQLNQPTKPQVLLIEHLPGQWSRPVVFIAD